MSIKETVLKNSKVVYSIVIMLGISILSLFTYMSYVFYQAVQGTGYVFWTYLIASPTIFALILILTLLFVGEKQTTSEIADFLGEN